MNRLLAIIILALTISVGDAKQKTVTLKSVMRCANCENRIKQNLSKVTGVKAVKTDLKAQQVTIIYDSQKTTKKKLQNILEKNNTKNKNSTSECGNKEKCCSVNKKQ